MADARVVFHLPAKHLQDWRGAQHLVLFRRIADCLGPQGLRIEVRDRRAGPFNRGETDAYDDGDLHIIDSGRARGRGVLNAAIAYLHPFWHLDPIGVLAESRIGGMVYDPARVPFKPARTFMDGLRKRYVLPRLSRRAQPSAVSELPKGAIAVFLQGPQSPESGLVYCTPDAMLQAVARGAGGRPVLVKPHPLALGDDTAVIARAIAAGLAVSPTNANIHDMIAASVATVSFNSSCAVEGFLHRKPAILFGLSDLHHFSETVRDPETFADALHRALSRPSGGYAQFLQWYFDRNCLNVAAADLQTRLLAIFAEAGFGPDRLGLQPPPSAH